MTEQNISPQLVAADWTVNMTAENVGDFEQLVSLLDWLNPEPQSTFERKLGNLAEALQRCIDDFHDRRSDCETTGCRDTTCRTCGY